MNDKIKNALISLAKEFSAKKLVLFGSALTSYDDAHDIDIACEGVTGRKFLRFGAKLEELFNKSVDLVLIEEDSRFIKEVLKNGVVIYES
jgi:predicted nucleotidyltransferase